jgi:hypothetical protein
VKRRDRKLSLKGFRFERFALRLSSFERLQIALCKFIFVSSIAGRVLQNQTEATGESL